VEQRFLLRKEAELKNDITAVGELITFAYSLQNRVKQAIEVMEETNGNTLRVFTMVTVLYVPMYVSARTSLEPITLHPPAKKKTFSNQEQPLTHLPLKPGPSSPASSA
jgi:hypothetical protein